MWKENPVFCEDMQRLSDLTYIPWEMLQNKTILVTGATGLIGYTLVCALMFADLKKGLGIRVIAIVRDVERAKIKYKELLDDGCNLSFVEGDVKKLPFVEEKIHYIVHGASQTASAAFIAHPLETIETAITGTKNLLELARSKSIRSFVYLSSMEAYGAPTKDVLLTEDAGACFDSMSVRSCYPESKRMCEALCAAYVAEHSVPAKAIRLAQTFGPGVAREDKRVFADFARKALKNEEIIMQTKGDSCRMYLYTMDAVAAIMTVLLKGEDGQCYNAANKATYCSIREMAELVSCVLSGGRAKVTVQMDEENMKKYPPTHRLRLDTTKLEGLGWRAENGLEEMYIRMVKGF